MRARRRSGVSDEGLPGAVAARNFVGVAGDENFASIENRTAPWRAGFLLAAANRVGGRLAAVNPFDLRRGLVHAHHGKESVADHVLHQPIDRDVELDRFVGRGGQSSQRGEVAGGQSALLRAHRSYRQALSNESTPGDSRAYNIPKASFSDVPYKGGHHA